MLGAHRHLRVAALLESLVARLHDRAFQVREVALRLLVRLAVRPLVRRPALRVLLCPSRRPRASSTARAAASRRAFAARIAASRASRRRNSAGNSSPRTSAPKHASSVSSVASASCRRRRSRGRSHAAECSRCRPASPAGSSSPTGRCAFPGSGRRQRAPWRDRSRTACRGRSAPGGARTGDGPAARRQPRLAARPPRRLAPNREPHPARGGAVAILDRDDLVLSVQVVAGMLRAGDASGEDSVFVSSRRACRLCGRRLHFHLVRATGTRSSTDRPLAEPARGPGCWRTQVRGCGWRRTRAAGGYWSLPSRMRFATRLASSRPSTK